MCARVCVCVCARVCVCVCVCVRVCSVTVCALVHRYVSYLYVHILRVDSTASCAHVCACLLTQLPFWCVVYTGCTTMPCTRRPASCLRTFPIPHTKHTCGSAFQLLNPLIHAHTHTHTHTGCSTKPSTRPLAFCSSTSPTGLAWRPPWSSWTASRSVTGDRSPACICWGVELGFHRNRKWNHNNSGSNSGSNSGPEKTSIICF